jgi:hypothetical protein
MFDKKNPEVECLDCLLKILLFFNKKSQSVNYRTISEADHRYFVKNLSWKR